jgi:outer membrane protein assembly factor BamE
MGLEPYFHMLFCRLKLPTVLAAALVFVLVSTLSSGCSFLPKIYRIDIEQGNIFMQKQVTKLKIGMSKAEVREILGTTLLSHHMHADRWDYYYSFVSGQNGKKKEKHLELHFKSDKLISIKEWTETDF